MTRWTRTSLRPQTPNVQGMLSDQVALTLDGVQAFSAWAIGDLARADFVINGARNVVREADLLGVLPAQRTQGMAELLEQRHLSDVLARREIYRPLTHISDSVVPVAERVWYTRAKEA